MRSFRLIASIIVAGLLIWSRGAGACPFCDGGFSGENEVKQIVFGADFWVNLVAVLLPFVFFVGVPVVIHCWPTHRASRIPV